MGDNAERPDELLPFLPNEERGAAGVSSEVEFAARVDRLISRGLERYGAGDLLAALCDWEHALALDANAKVASEYISYVRNNFQILEEEFRLAREIGTRAVLEVESDDEDRPKGDDGELPVLELGGPANREPGSSRAPKNEEGWDLDELGGLVTTQPGSTPNAPEKGDLLHDYLAALSGDLLMTPLPTKGPVKGGAQEPPDLDFLADLDRFAEATIPGAAPLGMESISPLGAGQDAAPFEAHESQEDQARLRSFKVLDDDEDVAESSFARPELKTTVESEFDDGRLTHPNANRLDDSEQEHEDLLILEPPSLMLDQNNPEAQRAFAFLKLAEEAITRQDVPAAVEAAAAAFHEASSDSIVNAILDRFHDLLVRIYNAHLGSRSRIPVVIVPMHQIAAAKLDNRTGFLLSRIDGMLSYEDILDVSGMSQLDACRILSDLLYRGFIEAR